MKMKIINKIKKRTKDRKKYTDTQGMDKTTKLKRDVQKAEATIRRYRLYIIMMGNISLGRRMMI